jgi:transposase, IS30 family
MKHLSEAEREKIMIMLEQWFSHRKIWKVLKRHHSTISDEITRNSVKWKYAAHKARHKAYVRRLYCKKQIKKIRVNDDLEEFIREKIKDDWTPEMVSWYWNKHQEELHISTPTIYKYIASKRWYSLREHLYSNQKKWKRRWVGLPRKEIIKNRVWIDFRPEKISKLLEFGHYECDLILWPQWKKECLLVLIEKVTRFKICKKLPTKSPYVVEKELKKYIKMLWIKSITFDNWVEFMNHENLWIPTYFCRPYHSREKAQVERWNRDFRRFFPKWTDFSKISQKEIDIITEKINNMPMKILWFKSPAECFKELSWISSQVSVLTL